MKMIFIFHTLLADSVDLAHPFSGFKMKHHIYESDVMVNADNFWKVTCCK